MGHSNHRVAPATSALALVATILGSFLVRLAGAATGVMLGLFLSTLHRRGAAYSSEMVVSLLTALFYLAELAGAPIAGLLIDRRGLRPLLFAGPLLGIVATILIDAPTRLHFLSVARLLQGLTTACTVPAALAFLSHATEDKAAGRGRLMGFFEAGSIGGLAVGYTVGGFLWDHLQRDGFWYLILIYGLAAALFVLVKVERGEAIKRPPSASWRALIHTLDLMPSWLALSAAAGIWFGHAAYQLSGGSPRPHQLLTIGFSGSTIGIIFGVYTLLFATGTVIWGWLIGRVPVSFAMRAGSIGVVTTALALVGINHVDGFDGLWFTALIALGLVAVALETAFTPAALTLLASRSDAVPEGRGAVMGVYSMLLGAGQLIGAAVGGMFARAWGVDGLVVATALLGVIGLLTLPSNLGLLRLPGSSAGWHAHRELLP